MFDCQPSSQICCQLISGCLISRSTSTTAAASHKIYDHTRLSFLSFQNNNNNCWLCIQFPSWIHLTTMSSKMGGRWSGCHYYSFSCLWSSSRYALQVQQKMRMWPSTTIHRSESHWFIKAGTSLRWQAQLFDGAVAFVTDATRAVSAVGLLVNSFATLAVVHFTSKRVAAFNYSIRSWRYVVNWSQWNVLSQNLFNNSVIGLFLVLDFVDRHSTTSAIGKGRKLVAWLNRWIDCSRYVKHDNMQAGYSHPFNFKSISIVHFVPSMMFSKTTFGVG